MSIDNWLLVLLRMDKTVFFAMVALSLCGLAKPMSIQSSTCFFLSLGAGKYLALLADGLVGLSSGNNNCELYYTSRKIISTK